MSFLESLLSSYALWQWGLIVGVLTLGSVVQGTVGFASGLVSLPLLVLGGVPLHEAAAINFLLTTMQNVVGAWQLRGELTYQDVALPVVARWVALPLGAAAMRWAVSLDQGLVKQMIGLMLLAMVVLLWGWRVKHVDRAPAPLTLLAFLTSGFLLGFASIGGAPMVLYVNSLTWDASKCRAFLFFASATGAPLMALLLVWNFGAGLLPACFAALLSAPFCWLGVHLGLRLGKGLNKPLFRRLTYSLLTIIALVSLVSPYLTRG